MIFVWGNILNKKVEKQQSRRLSEFYPHNKLLLRLRARCHTRGLARDARKWWGAPFGWDGGDAIRERFRV